MGRENGDTTMVSSSIALLQERFRKLERIKEKRQEKELLKLFLESETIVGPNPSPILAAQFEANRFTYPEPMILPNRPQPPSQDCLLSLGPNYSKGKHLDFLPMKNKTSSLWPNTAGSSSSISARNFENSEVDTSLHL